MLLEIRVGARVRVKVRARIRDSWGTKRLGHEMSGSPSEHGLMFQQHSRVTSEPKKYC